MRVLFGVWLALPVLAGCGAVEEDDAGSYGATVVRDDLPACGGECEEWGLNTFEPTFGEPGSGAGGHRPEDESYGGSHDHMGDEGLSETDSGPTDSGPDAYVHVDSAVGTFDLLTGLETTPESACVMASDMQSSGVAPGCPDCTFAFFFDLVDSERTLCEDNSFDGAALGLGLTLDYDGYGAYVMYEYYGDWWAVFPAYNEEPGYTYFIREDAYDYAYDYYGTPYYLTRVFYGHIFAY